MIIPDKFCTVKQSKLYKAINYYRSTDKIEVSKVKKLAELDYLIILYSLGYLDYELRGDEIEIKKIKD